jgi:hypothetical protein
MRGVEGREWECGEKKKDNDKNKSNSKQKRRPEEDDIPSRKTIRRDPLRDIIPDTPPPPP